MTNVRKLHFFFAPAARSFLMKISLITLKLVPQATKLSFINEQKHDNCLCRAPQAKIFGYIER